MTQSTIQLLICVASLIWIVWLFLGYGAKHARQQDTKVHTIYLSGIGTLIILELIVYICLQASVDKRTIMETVAFGATLSSLIMSVLAIIFTITSSKGNDMVVGRIEGAINQLETTAHGLIRFSEIAHDIDNKTNSLIKQIDKLQSFEESKWNTFSSDVISNLNSRMPSETDAGYPKDNMNEVYEEYISRASFLGTLGLFACVYSFKKRNSKKSSKFNMRSAFAFLPEDINLNYIDYIYGFMVASSGLDIINISLEDDDDVQVYYIDKDVESMLMRRLQAQLSIDKELEKDRSDLSALDAFNSIRKYFNLNELSEEDISETE